MQSVDHYQLLFLRHGDSALKSPCDLAYQEAGRSIECTFTVIPGLSSSGAIKLNCSMTGAAWSAGADDGRNRITARHEFAPHSSFSARPATFANRINIHTERSASEVALSSMSNMAGTSNFFSNA